MYKKFQFRGSFNKEHGKRAEALLKSPSEQLYPIYWSLPSQFSCKKSLLVTSQTLGRLGNTLPAYKKYPLLKRHNLTIPIQMRSSQKEKTFSLFSAAFLKSRWNFEHFDKKDAFIDFVILKFRTMKM